MKKSLKNVSKLSLKKETIAILDKHLADKVKGGARAETTHQNCGAHSCVPV